ncbi:MAG: hypothetical protein ACI8WB_003246 [Phenylobacterium sp.]|jgi:hypothetical protein
MNKTKPISALKPASTLVAFTTCARPQIIRHNLNSLLQSLTELDDIDLVVAIDGLSIEANQATLSEVLAMGVNCIVADEPEGVGISKNRVMSLLGDYDYYFFIEDDVEVVNGRLFTGHIDMHLQTGIHHFSLHEPTRLNDEIEPTRLGENDVIRHAQYGSAQVNFFTQTALAEVGGWHQHFGELRRGGHTEHSYRVCNAGLCPAPFNYIDGLVDSCCWHNPASIVRPGQHAVATNQLFEVENALISRKLGQQPWYAKHPGRLCLAKSLAKGLAEGLAKAPSTQEAV